MDMLSITGAVLPQDTQLQPGSQAGSKGGPHEWGDAGQAERDTDRAKKDMLVRLAGEVVQAPRDVGGDLVAAAQARCVALQAEANRLARELAQTLGPWVLDRHPTVVARYRDFGFKLNRGQSIQSQAWEIYGDNDESWRDAVSAALNDVTDQLGETRDNYEAAILQVRSLPNIRSSM